MLDYSSLQIKKGVLHFHSFLFLIRFVQLYSLHFENILKRSQVCFCVYLEYKVAYILILWTL